MEKGKVYLVGAGPGDPGLITVKGLELIASAEVIVYDHLANPELLRAANPGAKLIYVGKVGTDHTLEQKGIGKVLIEEARAGKKVVRLKGGDPFLFGRGGEEIEALEEAGIPFEVVPGVTSAIAAPAYAGIPVTHRDLASSVAFITGHRREDEKLEDLDWEGIARGADTLVFLMGVANLDKISANLIKGGRIPETPVALIRWGTTPREETLIGTLGDIAQKATEKNFQPPVIIVVGEVVKLHAKFSWFEKKPLFGKRVLVTRTREQASDLVKILAEQGAEVIEFPTIALAPPESWAPLDRAIEQLSGYHWIIFTSPNAVPRFFTHLAEKGKDARSLGNCQIAAIGPATADALATFGLITDLLPSTFQAEGLIEAFSKIDLKGKKILLPRAAEARDILPEELTKLGAAVEVVPVYKTVLPDTDPTRLRETVESRPIDVLTFTSSSTVINFLKMLNGINLKKVLNGTFITCIGPITAQTAEASGLKVSAVAKDSTIESLVETIVKGMSR